MAGELHKINCKSIIQRCVSDHAHLLFHLSKRHALCDVIEEVMKRSSRWVKQRDVSLRRFYWQAGYGAFAVGRSEMKAVEAYIARQDEHHRTISFQEEFRGLLRAHEVAFDERYVWD